MHGSPASARRSSVAPHPAVEVRDVTGDEEEDGDDKGEPIDDHEDEHKSTLPPLPALMARVDPTVRLHAGDYLPNEYTRSVHAFITADDSDPIANSAPNSLPSSSGAAAAAAPAVSGVEAREDTVRWRVTREGESAAPFGPGVAAAAGAELNVVDACGQNVVYTSATAMMRRVTSQLMALASLHIQTHRQQQVQQSTYAAGAAAANSSSSRLAYDMIDRWAVLHDLYECEVAFQTAKLALLNVWLSVYEHALTPASQRAVATQILALIELRPRLDVSRMAARAQIHSGARTVMQGLYPDTSSAAPSSTVLHATDSEIPYFTTHYLAHTRLLMEQARLYQSVVDAQTAVERYYYHHHTPSITGTSAIAMSSASSVSASSSAAACCWRVWEQSASAFAPNSTKAGADSKEPGSPPALPDSDRLLATLRTITLSAAPTPFLFEGAALAPPPSDEHPLSLHPPHVASDALKGSRELDLLALRPTLAPLLLQLHSNTQALRDRLCVTPYSSSAGINVGVAGAHTASSTHNVPHMAPSVRHLRTADGTASGAALPPLHPTTVSSELETLCTELSVIRYTSVLWQHYCARSHSSTVGTQTPALARSVPLHPQAFAQASSTLYQPHTALLHTLAHSPLMYHPHRIVSALLPPPPPLPTASAAVPVLPIPHHQSAELEHKRRNSTSETHESSESESDETTDEDEDDHMHQSSAQKPAASPRSEAKPAPTSKRASRRNSKRNSTHGPLGTAHVAAQPAMTVSRSSRTAAFASASHVLQALPLIDSLIAQWRTTTALHSCYRAQAQSVQLPLAPHTHILLVSRQVSKDGAVEWSGLTPFQLRTLAAVGSNGERTATDLGPGAAAAASSSAGNSGAAIGEWWDSAQQPSGLLAVSELEGWEESSAPTPAAHALRAGAWRDLQHFDSILMLQPLPSSVSFLVQSASTITLAPLSSGVAITPSTTNTNTTSSAAAGSASPRPQRVSRSHALHRLQRAMSWITVALQAQTALSFQLDVAVRLQHVLMHTPEPAGALQQLSTAFGASAAVSGRITPSADASTNAAVISSGRKAGSLSAQTFVSLTRLKLVAFQWLRARLSRLSAASAAQSGTPITPASGVVFPTATDANTKQTSGSAQTIAETKSAATPQSAPVSAAPSPASAPVSAVPTQAPHSNNPSPWQLAQRLTIASVYFCHALHAFSVPCYAFETFALCAHLTHFHVAVLGSEHSPFRLMRHTATPFIVSGASSSSAASNAAASGGRVSSAPQQRSALPPEVAQFLSYFSRSQPDVEHVLQRLLVATHRSTRPSPAPPAVAVSTTNQTLPPLVTSESRADSEADSEASGNSSGSDEEQEVALTGNSKPVPAAPSEPSATDAQPSAKPGEFKLPIDPLHSVQAQHKHLAALDAAYTQHVLWTIPSPRALVSMCVQFVAAVNAPRASSPHFHQDIPQAPEALTEEQHLEASVSRLAGMDLSALRTDYGARTAVWDVCRLSRALVQCEQLPELVRTLLCMG
jgi:hypothetical protein